MSKNEIHEIIRVDHAGELGAKWIYEGQLKWIKDPKAKAIIQEMYAQEIEHLQYFTQMMQQRRVRPTMLMPLWKLLSKTMGAVSAVLGPKVAMGCTEAVEEVIDQHYADQINILRRQYFEEEELLARLIQFREDECHHRDTALQYNEVDSFRKKILKESVKFAVRVAISVSKRI